MTRVSIVIQSATERGYVIQEDGQIVAALTSRAEVAEWIERRLGELIPEELDRERREIEEVQQTLPRVVASRGKGFFGGSRT